MFKKYNIEFQDTPLRPLALTVILTSFGIACLLVGTASMGPSAMVTGSYEISREP